MRDRVGQQLGNYRLLRLIGRGATAEVYLGEHIFLKRRAALKVMYNMLADEEVNPFLLEACTLARLTHPNIVSVHEFDVEEGTPFLVIDYAPRGTLRSLHPTGSCLSLATTVSYVKQIAAALQYAHNHQVIHRDIKPENMLVGSRQGVLLSDFGISLLAPPDLLTTKEMVGTVPYVAPEQIRGKPCFASDQYSLAILAYEWLCGARPFAGDAWRIIYQQLSASPPPLRERDPSLPQAVEDVVLKALAKDPKKRYVSVQLFAQALERASQVNPRPPSSSHKTVALTPIAERSSNPAPATSKRVFISAAEGDLECVARLTADLQRCHITIWQEGMDSNTQQGFDQENLVRQAMRAVDVVLVVVSPSTHCSHTVREHLRIASLYQRKFMFVWIQGDECTPVFPAPGGKAAPMELIDARGERYGIALEELAVSLTEEDAPADDAIAEPVEEPRNPYKGLRAFKQDDASDFFGRDMLIQELVNSVKDMFTSGQSDAATARLLAVIGPSGSGKSSVVMAGLLPQLQRGILLPKSKQWLYLEPMVPGAYPLKALALMLAPYLPHHNMQSLQQQLQGASARGLHLLASQIVKTAEQKVVLLIDQFEELFTLTTSQQEREHFINLLIAATTQPQGPVVVLLTLRADFYDRPLSYAGLGRLILTHQVGVLPMEMADLRIAIKQPALLPDVQLSFEDGLVGDLLFEVQGQAGALPLVQFVLEQLFEQRHGHRLTLKAYHEIGGVKGALARHAETTYNALPSEEHRKLARAMFLRLIDPGMTEQDTTRRRAALAELSLPDPIQTTILCETTDAFIAARLLTTNVMAGTTTVEVSHEALIREWPRLASWMREARDDIPLQQTLSSDVTAWEQRLRPKDRLYRGSQLKEAQAWAKRNIPSKDEATFLRASNAQRMQLLASVIAILLLLASTTGIASWLVLQPQPDPTHVTNLKDDESLVGSLRWAINKAPSGSTIAFDKSLWGHTIQLADDLPISGKNLTIQGPGQYHLTINSTHGIILYANTTIRISGLALTGSKANTESLLSNHGRLYLSNSMISDNTVLGKSGSNGAFNSRNSGSGVYNDGTLYLISSTVSNNRASAQYYKGSGIYNSGTLSLTNSTVSNNIISGQSYTSSTSFNSTSGGGIYNTGTLSLTNSTVSGNRVSGQNSNAGGIYNSGTLSLTNSTVSANTAYSTIPDQTLIAPHNYNGLPSSGGGIYNTNVLTLANSTISGNVISGQNSNGGGILNRFASKVTITNSTISGNRSSSKGGGIANIGSHVDLEFCTIYGNKAIVNGGGLSIEDGQDNKKITIPSKVSIHNSIIAGNRAKAEPSIAGALISESYNLIQNIPGANFTPNVTDVSMGANADLRLDSLYDNGGPALPHTFTHALLPGSPASDKIPLAACHANGISTDQRGIQRPNENKQFCDIGAYEGIAVNS